MTIEYSRPNVKGGTIFGDLVPYDKIWRVGDNASTKMFDREQLAIDDHYKLSPGIYAIYDVPGKE